MKFKLPGNWKKVKIEDVASFNKSNYKKRDNWDFVNYLDTGNIINGVIDEIKYIDLESGKLPSRAKRKVIKDDVIYSTVRPIQKHLGIIKKPMDNLLVSTGFTVITSDREKVNPLYVYFYLNQKPLTQQLQSIAEQRVSTYPALNISDIKNIRINLPPLSEQKVIVDTLSALDDIIDLNNKVNENLEQQVQSIFEHWFVNFEFPDINENPYKSSGGDMRDSELGLIPKDWEVFKLGDKAKIELGGTPPRKNESYWGGDINWINSGELNSYRISQATEKITKKGLRKSSTKLWTKNTTVIAITGATLGQTSLLLIDTCANQSVVGIKENEDIPYTFLYPFIISKIPELVGHQTGGAQQHINKGNVEGTKILLPGKKLLFKYNDIVKSHYQQIEKNEFENINLSELRTILLPKLMSGEMRLPLN